MSALSCEEFLLEEKGDSTKAELDTKTDFLSFFLSSLSSQFEDTGNSTSHVVLYLPPFG